VSLIDERESLFREIAELQSARGVFLEETTMLNARNEELAQLNAHYMRSIEAISSESSMPAQEKRLFEHERERQQPSLVPRPSHTVNSSFGASSDESADLGKYTKGQQKAPTGDAHSRMFKWRGNNKETIAAGSAAHAQDGPNEKAWLGHTFQQVSVLRLSKCDHCGEKLWASQARCQSTSLRGIVHRAVLKERTTRPS
jgi:Rho-type GTPase-activating protein 1/2